MRPALQHSVDLRQYSIASLVSLPACAKQLVVVCMNMPDVGAHGERNHLGIEPLRIGGSTDTSRVLEAGMLRDRHRLGLGTAGIEAADVRRKLATILDIDFGVPYCAAFARPSASVAVRETLLLSPSERCLLHEDALPLISIPRSTEPH